jgi:hypothetical protein
MPAAEEWREWEAARITAALRPDDTVIVIGPGASALLGTLTAAAGWVFAEAADDRELMALRATLDPVRPANLTVGLPETMRAWCPGADVVLLADWYPESAPSHTDLDAWAGRAERSLTVTGWRTLSRNNDDPALPGNGVDRAIQHAQDRILEARIISTPVGDDRLRTVVVIAAHVSADHDTTSI